MSKEISSDLGKDEADTPRSKARKRLYCDETISSMDDDFHPRSSQSFSGHRQGNTFKLERLTLTACCEREVCVCGSNQGGGEQTQHINSTHSCKTKKGGGKFVRGLLNEFTKGSSQNVKASTSTHAFDNEATLTVSSRNDEQEVPDIAAEEDAQMGGEDILVIHDDFLTSSCVDSDSGSEIDWSSLTPPAPRSPSDQRVPDWDEEKTVGSRCNGLMSSHGPVGGAIESMFGSSLLEFEHSSYFRSIHIQPTSYSYSLSSDHVVPEFSG